VWPAYWTQGSNWPDDGEIDIVENVNLATANRYALHTLNGCRHQDPSPNFPESGRLSNPDCFNQTNGNEGCLVQETQDNSFGAGFRQAGGGVYALLWDNDGMKIWFFTRSRVPSDLSSGGSNPNPSSWGTPSAFYSSTACDFNKFFGPQTIIFVSRKLAINIHLSSFDSYRILQSAGTLLDSPLSSHLNADKNFVPTSLPTLPISMMHISK
jgi:hypothetical protein